jgi:hypothetical protein
VDDFVEPFVILIEDLYRDCGRNVGLWDLDWQDGEVLHGDLGGFVVGVGVVVPVLLDGFLVLCHFAEVALIDFVRLLKEISS